jgi:hypothetical protein
MSQLWLQTEVRTEHDVATSRAIQLYSYTGIQLYSYTAIQVYSTVITLLWLALPTEDVCIQSDAAMQDSLIDRIWKETIWANRGNVRGWKKKTTVTLIPAEVRKRSFSDTRQEVIKLKCSFSNVRSVGQTAIAIGWCVFMCWEMSMTSLS